jgi:hypothetical protein
MQLGCSFTNCVRGGFYMRNFITRTEAEQFRGLKPNYKVRKEEVLEYVQRRMERLYGR